MTPHLAPAAKNSLCAAMFRWRLRGGIEDPESARQVPKVLDLYLTSSRGRGLDVQPPAASRPSTRHEHNAGAREPMKIEIDLDRLADELATLVAERLKGQIGSPEPSPRMGMADVIAYTGIPAGTFRKWVAEGRIPSHGGRRRVFHRAELDAALGHIVPGPSSAPIPLRRPHVA
jgi:excisionase family DNA binding protein